MDSKFIEELGAPAHSGTSWNVLACSGLLILSGNWGVYIYIYILPSAGIRGAPQLPGSPGF